MATTQPTGLQSDPPTFQESGNLKSLSPIIAVWGSLGKWSSCQRIASLKLFPSLPQWMPLYIPSSPKASRRPQNPMLFGSNSCRLILKITCISRSSSFIPVFPTKKALFLFLSNYPILHDGGKMSFSLDKKTGKKCFTVAPRVLTFTGVNDPIHFITVHEEVSRFVENESREEAEERASLVSLDDREDSHFLLGTLVPRNRPDEWLEVEIGSFFNVGRNPDNLGEVESIVFAMGDFSMYLNIIVQGIEFRPKPIV
nr:F-box protein PP2-B10-like [Ipomoea batatas]